MYFAKPLLIQKSRPDTLIVHIHYRYQPSYTVSLVRLSWKLHPLKSSPLSLVSQRAPLRVWCTSKTMATSFNSWSAMKRNGWLFQHSVRATNSLIHDLLRGGRLAADALGVRGTLPVFILQREVPLSPFLPKVSWAKIDKAHPFYLPAPSDVQRVIQATELIWFW